MSRCRREISPKSPGLALIWLAVLVCQLAGGSASAAARPHPKVVLLVVDQVHWEDLLQPGLPHFAQVISQGSVGLMNARAVNSSSGAAYLTIGAGSRLGDSVSGWTAGLGMAAEERYQGRLVADLYRSRTGAELPAGAIGNLAVATIQQENSALGYSARPGLLGASLEQAGLVAACLGNGDSLLPSRLLVNLVMNQQGRVPIGEVGRRLLRPAPSLPWGIEADLAAYRQAFQRLWPQADLLAVDLAETSRSAQAVSFLLPPVFKQARRRALEKVDQFLGFILSNLGNGVLLVVTPSPFGVDQERDALCPVVLYRPGGPAGLLASPTTRTPGVVTNLDLAPTILQSLGVAPPADMFGHPLTTLPRPAGGQIVELMQAKGRFDHQTQTYKMIVFPFQMGLSALMMLGAAALLVPARFPHRLGRLLAGLAAMAAAFPGVLLALAIWPMAPLSGLAAALAVAAVGGAIALKWPGAFFLIAAASSLTVLGDLLFGGWLLHYTPLGHSPLEGARYYGLGNEYGAVLVGAVPLALVGWSKTAPGRLHRWLAAGIFAWALVMVAAPWWGANFGMAISAAVGFSYVMARLWWPGRKRRAFSLALLSVAGAVAVSLVMETAWHGSASHLGRLVSLVQAEGAGQIASLASRKLAMNWMLIRYTPWTLLVIAESLALAAGWLMGVGGQGLRLAVAAGVLGAVAALAFNDSGVVACSLALLYPAAAFIVSPKPGRPGLVKAWREKSRSGKLPFHPGPPLSLVTGPEREP